DRPGDQRGLRLCDFQPQWVRKAVPRPAPPLPARQLRDAPVRPRRRAAILGPVRRAAEQDRLFQRQLGLRDPPRAPGLRAPQSDANVTLSYPFQIGPATVTLQGYLFNLFNRQTPTYIDTVYSTVPPPGYYDDERTAILNPNQPPSNDTYGKITERTPGRYFRA